MVGMLSIRDIKKAVAAADGAVPHVIEWRQEQKQPGTAPAFDFATFGFGLL